MPAISELSRRKFLKAAAGGAVVLAFIPLLGERRRASAQETNPQTTPEKEIEIPWPESLEDHIKVFTSFIQDSMTAEALENLGLTPFLTEQELIKQNAVQKFTVEKGEKYVRDNILYSLDYALHLSGAERPFKASYESWYASSFAKPFLYKGIVFDIGQDGKLRKYGDKSLMPSDTLQPILSSYFELPGNMEWRVVPETGPDWAKFVSGKGEENNEFRKVYSVGSNTRGGIGFMLKITEPQKTS